MTISQFGVCNPAHAKIHPQGNNFPILFNFRNACTVSATPPKNLQYSWAENHYLLMNSHNQFEFNTSHKTRGGLFQRVWSICFVFGVHAWGPSWGMLNIISLKFIYGFDISKCPADQLEGMQLAGYGWALDHKAFVMGLKWCTWNTRLALSADILLLQQRQLCLHEWNPPGQRRTNLGNL